jgi:uncharacterized delta-60 repeat protein
MVRRAAAVVVVIAVFAPLASAAPGDLDRTWGKGGSARTPLTQRAQRWVSAYAVTVTREGVLVSGIAGHPDFPQPFLVRYTKRGRLAPTYGTGGIVRVDDREGGGQLGATLPNGKVVLMGEPLRRLDGRGRLDHTFGVRGRARLRMGRCRYFATGILRQPDGKLVVEVESCRSLRGQIDNAYSLMRLHPDGRIDRRFGRNGLAVARVGVRWGSTGSSALARQPDGKLLLGGRAYQNGRDVVALVRFRSDGRLDRSFGNDGMVFTPWDDAEAYRVFVHPDGKLLLAGCSESGPRYEPRPLTVRYLPDGTPDSSWGAGGIRLHSVPAVSCPDYAMTPQRQLLILVSRLWRFNPDGSVDSSFGQRGSIGVGPGADGALGIQRDGKLVVAGGTAVSRHRIGIDVRRYHGG